MSVSLVSIDLAEREDRSIEVIFPVPTNVPPPVELPPAGVTAAPAAIDPPPVAAEKPPEPPLEGGHLGGLRANRVRSGIDVGRHAPARFGETLLVEVDLHVGRSIPRNVHREARRARLESLRFLLRELRPLPTFGLGIERRYLPPSSLGVGLLVGKKYRLLEHTDLGYIVGIKFLHKAIANRRESLGRFDREAKIAARLGEASRHMTKVHDHGTLPGGMPYVVMELLEGEGLDARLKAAGKLPFEQIVEILLQLSKALQIAHDQNVVHRDLKPANIFLTKAEDDTMLVKLLDFGVAKATLDNASYATTNTGALIGTPSYMSPEQLGHGGVVDWRSDLWAMVLIVYRMAVGAHPFGRGTLEELAMKIITSPPILPSEVVGGLPRGFDAWIAKGLQKKPGQRFQSARELASSLAALRSGEPVPLASAPPATVVPVTEPATIVDTLVVDAPPTELVYSRPRPATAETNPGLDRTMLEAGSVRKPRAGERSVFGLVAAVGLLLGVGTVLFVLSRKPAAPVAVTSPVSDLQPLAAPSTVIEPLAASAAPSGSAVGIAIGRPPAAPSGPVAKPRTPTRPRSDVDTRAKNSWDKSTEM